MFFFRMFLFLIIKLNCFLFSKTNFLISFYNINLILEVVLKKYNYIFIILILLLEILYFYQKEKKIVFSRIKKNFL